MKKPYLIITNPHHSNETIKQFITESKSYKITHDFFNPSVNKEFAETLKLAFGSEEVNQINIATPWQWQKNTITKDFSKKLDA
ncbi:MAG: hypothetical protein HC836_44920 [Richelia sp. RM2_1_2]|nr:hypothetical protein [Richelia sp. RM2_1_2]